MKKYLSIIISLSIVVLISAIGYFSNQTTFAAPTTIYQRTILPETNITYNLGSTAAKWLNIYSQNASSTVSSATTFCLTGDTCRTTWPTGSSGSATGWASSTDPTSIYFTGSGNVGIGTSTPTGKLNIASTVNARLTLTDSDAAVNAKHWFIDSNNNYFSIGTTSDSLGTDTSIISISGTNGKVGIGKTNPTEKLTVLGGNIELREMDDEYASVIIGSGNSTGSFRFYNSGTLNTYIGSAQSDTTYFNAGPVGIASTTAWAKLSVTNSGSIPSFIVEDQTSPDQSPFIITANGSVGIGTSTPEGNLNIAAISDARLVITDTNKSADKSWYFNNNDGIFSIGTRSVGISEDNPIITILNSSYKIGIGSTTPSAKLSINQPSTGIGLYLAGYANNVSDLFRVSTSTASATSTALIVDSNGRLGIGTTSPSVQLSVQGKALADDWLTYSPYSDKTNATEEIKNIKCISGTSKNGWCQIDHATLPTGVRVQETYKTVEVIGYKTVTQEQWNEEKQVNEEVEVKEPITQEITKQGDYMSLTKMTAVLTQSVQELDSRIKTLEGIKLGSIDSIGVFELKENIKKELRPEIQKMVEEAVDKKLEDLSLWDIIRLKIK